MFWDVRFGLESEGKPTRPLQNSKFFLEKGSLQNAIHSLAVWRAGEDFDPTVNYYAVLGVSKTAPAEDLKRAHRHPGWLRRGDR